MARIRTIKPELFTDRKLARCSISARWTFAGLLTESDDKGRQRYSAAKLVGTLYEHDHFAPKKLHAWVLELEREGIVHFYEDKDGAILCIPHFLKHQVVSKPSQSRLIPCPQNHNTPETPQEVPGDALESPGEAQGTVGGDPGTEVGSRNLEVGTRKLELGTEEVEVGDTRKAALARLQQSLFVEFCEVMDRNPAGDEPGKWGKVAKAMAREGVEPADVRERAELYRHEWPKVEFNPNALWSNWGRFDPAVVAANGAASQPGARDAMRAQQLANEGR